MNINELSSCLIGGRDSVNCLRMVYNFEVLRVMHARLYVEQRNRWKSESLSVFTSTNIWNLVFSSYDSIYNCISLKTGYFEYVSSPRTEIVGKRAITSLQLLIFVVS